MLVCDRSLTCLVSNGLCLWLYYDPIFTQCLSYWEIMNINWDKWAKFIRCLSGFFGDLLYESLNRSWMNFGWPVSPWEGSALFKLYDLLVVKDFYTTEVGFSVIIDCLVCKIQKMVHNAITMTQSLQWHSQYLFCPTNIPNLIAVFFVCLFFLFGTMKCFAW